ncbi:hypothetical protein PsYK624_122970 [Phanerochaete sordida]|uniref:Uncharacterized protein n=1 Tax=Phanerochaete sordida TaxID=48140 RepID=A0A9P3GKT8_9APHY|nr:hypothetical protein PsYK624_122970 [Phanerochaete sordida]
MEAYSARVVAARNRVSTGQPHLHADVLPLIAEHLDASLQAQYADPRVGFQRGIPIILANCSLVCEHWSRIFRRTLYQKVFIDRRRSLEVLTAAMRDPSCRARQCGSLVNELLVAVRRAPVAGSVLGLMTGPALEAVLASDLSTHLPCLEKLLWELSVVEPTRPLAQPSAPPHVAHGLPALLRTLTPVSTFEIQDKKFRTFAEVLSIIRAMSGLRHFRLRRGPVARQGPVRPQHISAAVGKLRSFFWSFYDAPWDGASGIVASILRLCGVDKGVASMVDGASSALYAPEDGRHRGRGTGQSSATWSLTLEYDSTDDVDWPVRLWIRGRSPGSHEFTLTFRERTDNASRRSCIPQTKFHIAIVPVPVTVDPLVQRTLATGCTLPRAPEYHTLLSRLDSHILPGCPLVITLDAEPDVSLAWMRQRLPAFMPRSHARHLVTIETIAWSINEAQEDRRATRGSSGS